MSVLSEILSDLDGVRDQIAKHQKMICYSTTILIPTKDTMDIYFGLQALSESVDAIKEAVKSSCKA